MPKPIVGDNGSRHARAPVGLEGRQEPVRAGDGYAGRASKGRCTTSAASSSTPSALNAITNPGTNSCKRLARLRSAGRSWPIRPKNRSASIRIPLSRTRRAVASKPASRIPDANLYLAFSALLMAWPGRRREQDPSRAIRHEGSAMTCRRKGRKDPTVCSSLEQALKIGQGPWVCLTKGGGVHRQQAMEAIQTRKSSASRMNTSPSSTANYVSRAMTGRASALRRKPAASRSRTPALSGGGATGASFAPIPIRQVIRASCLRPRFPGSPGRSGGAGPVLPNAAAQMAGLPPSRQPYTDQITPKEAAERGCRQLDGAPVTGGCRGGRTLPAAPAGQAGASGRDPATQQDWVAQEPSARSEAFDHLATMVAGARDRCQHAERRLRVEGLLRRRQAGAAPRGGGGLRLLKVGPMRWRPARGGRSAGRPPGAASGERLLVHAELVGARGPWRAGAARAGRAGAAGAAGCRRGACARPGPHHRRELIRKSRPRDQESGSAADRRPGAVAGDGARQPPAA